MRLLVRDSDADRAAKKARSFFGGPVTEDTKLFETAAILRLRDDALKREEKKRKSATVPLAAPRPRLAQPGERWLGAAPTASATTAADS